MKGIPVTVFALLAGILMLSDREALAGNCCDGGFGNTAIYSLSRIRSANKLAQSRVQLANGFADVLESVDEVMKAIMNDDSIG